MSAPLPHDDLDHVFHATEPLWSALEPRTRVLFTGASGFFGSWMLETFLDAATRLGRPFLAIALTRDAGRFAVDFPHFASDSRVELLEADAATMEVPEGEVDYVVHSLFAPAPLPEMEVWFRKATGRLVAIAREKRSKGALLCSTGAVYKNDSGGPIPEDAARFGAGDPLSYPRIRSQVEDDWLSGLQSAETTATLIRGFAFVGPRFPLDGQFAIGNFLRDALSGGPIVVRGDGTSIRSYLHAADLAIRLWFVLLAGKAGEIFNVGGSEPITIGQTAQTVADCLCPSEGVRILGEAGSFSHYVPSTSRIDQSFHLPTPIPFREAILRTAHWLAPAGRNIP